MANATELKEFNNRFRFYAFVLPLIFAVIGLAVQIGTLSSVPNPMTLNWQLNGSPSSEGSPWLNIVSTLVMGAVVPHLLALSVYSDVKRGRVGQVARMLGALIPALSFLVVALATLGQVVQLENNLASDAHMPAGLPPVVVLISIGIGFVAWFSVPAPTTALRLASDVATAPSGSALTAWQGTTRCTPMLGTIIGLLILMFILAPLIAWALSGALALIIILAVAALLAIMAGMSATVYKVRVDHTGLTATSRFGFPTFRVPMDDIVGVDIVDIQPMNDFGGWGIRWMPGRFGIILQSGHALRLIRRNGNNFVVTMPDPSVPAGVVQSIISTRDE